VSSSCIIASLKRKEKKNGLAFQRFKNFFSTKRINELKYKKAYKKRISLYNTYKVRKKSAVLQTCISATVKFIIN
jgi:hypothetical protein